MAIYFGNNQVKLYMGEERRALKLYEKPINNKVFMLSKDNFTLTDKNGLVLLAKEAK